MDSTTTPFQLFVNRYSAFTPDQGIPVRFTLGAPRFALRYDLAGSYPELAPQRSYFRAPRPEFARRYRDQLDKLGVDRILDGLTQRSIDGGWTDTRVVLLCFEDLRKPDTWCHRTLFAQWWENQTGQAVPELQPMEPTPKKTAASVLTEPLF